jgi:threonine dehydratase
VRGALNKMLALTPAERARGVVTASTGNHGAATAYAGRLAGVTPTVFVPHNAAPSKVERIRRLGGKVEYFGDDSAETETHARQAAAASGQVFLSPYNDWDVMAGQGTIGIELLSQAPSLAAVVVAVGGGGLIGGIASYLKAARPAVEIVGCSPKNSAVMAASVEAGRILELPSAPTLSDGTAGGVESGAITFEACRDLVSSYDLVAESEIAAAMRLGFEEERLVIEGAAGVAIASTLRVGRRWEGRDVAVVLCGGNVGLDVWCQVVGSKP